MLNRNLFSSATRTVMMVALFLIAGSSVASADEQSFRPGEYESIQGVASFERRSTVVSLDYCEGDSCVTPKVYWALMIQSGHSKYQLNQIFAEGSVDAPEHVELGSVIIRPGTHLSLEARVDVVTRDYVILSSPRKINFIMDLTELPSRQDFYGWTCHSLGEAKPLYVDIIQISREGEYTMRIQSVGETDQDPAQTLAEFDQVKFVRTDDVVNFAGSAHRINAELVIDYRGGKFNDFESSLMVTHSLLANRGRLPVETTMRLACNPTR